MIKFDQQFVHDIAQENYDQQMRAKHTSILQRILREAEKGDFSVVLEKDEIPLECIYWLNDKGFEIYTDTGENDDWFEMEDFNDAFRANRIKVVW